MTGGRSVPRKSLSFGTVPYLPRRADAQHRRPNTESFLPRSFSGPAVTRFASAAPQSRVPWEFREKMVWGGGGSAWRWRTRYGAPRPEGRNVVLVSLLLQAGRKENESGRKAMDRTGSALKRCVCWMRSAFLYLFLLLRSYPYAPPKSESKKERGEPAPAILIPNLERRR